MWSPSSHHRTAARPAVRAPASASAAPEATRVANAGQASAHNMSGVSTGDRFSGAYNTSNHSSNNEAPQITNPLPAVTNRKRRHSEGPVSRQHPKKVKLQVTPQMRGALMECCQKHGYREATSKEDKQNMRIKVFDEMNALFPDSIWNLDRITHEIANCRKRAWGWYDMLRLPGFSVNDHGMAEGPEEAWAHLLMRHPEADWMRSEPLGPRKPYEELFLPLPRGPLSPEIAMERESSYAIGHRATPPARVATVAADSPPARVAIVAAVPAQRVPEVKEERNLSVAPEENGPSVRAREITVGSPAEPDVLRNNDQHEVPVREPTSERVVTEAQGPEQVHNCETVITAIRYINAHLANRLSGPGRMKIFAVMGSQPIQATILLELANDDEKLAFLRALAAK